MKPMDTRRSKSVTKPRVGTSFSEEDPFDIEFKVTKSTQAAMKTEGVKSPRRLSPRHAMDPREDSIVQRGHDFESQYIKHNDANVFDPFAGDHVVKRLLLCKDSLNSDHQKRMQMNMSALLSKTASSGFKNRKSRDYEAKVEWTGSVSSDKRNKIGRAHV